jgi:hypothetical protein
MITSLKNRMTRSLVKVFVPATLGLVLITTSFALADGPGGSGYPSAAASTDLPADDGPGLGGGYGPSGNSNCVTLEDPGISQLFAIHAPADDGPGLGGGYATINLNPIASDGPGSSTPYAI